MMSLGKHFSRWPFLGIFRKIYGFEDARLEQDLMGLHFDNPVGVAAGFDKKAQILKFWPALGFGHIEVGTVTPIPQIGNPKPRMFRLPLDHGAVNRMGFNNYGVGALSQRLHHRPVDTVIGGNIGKNKVTPNAEAVKDYEICFSALFEDVDYFVVNVSSPNTPGLRDLQEKKPLLKILNRLQTLNNKKDQRKPILLKIAPDLTDGQLDDIVEVVIESKIDGVIATNTTSSRKGLVTSDEKVEAFGAGGVSGDPVRERSTEVIRILAKKCLDKDAKPRFLIIGVGGIRSAQHAYEKIRAGASLVQVYTGMVYEGPGLAAQINKGLVKLMERDGFSSITEVVGLDV